MVLGLGDSSVRWSPSRWRCLLFFVFCLLIVGCFSNNTGALLVQLVVPVGLALSVLWPVGVYIVHVVYIQTYIHAHSGTCSHSVTFIQPSLCLCGVLCPSVELLLSSPYLDYPTFVIATVIIVFIVHSFVFLTPVYELRRISHLSTPGHRIWFRPTAMVFGCSSVVLVHSVHACHVLRCHRTKIYKERKRGPFLFFSMTLLE